MTYAQSYRDLQVHDGLSLWSREGGLIPIRKHDDHHNSIKCTDPCYHFFDPMILTRNERV
jgi:hypothetical protein